MKKPLDSDFEHRLLQSLQDQAKKRNRTIEEVKRARQIENRRHNDTLIQLTAQHRQANRDLLDLIDRASEEGLRKSVIYGAVGLSGQRIGDMRRSLELTGVGE